MSSDHVPRIKFLITLLAKKVITIKQETCRLLQKFEKLNKIIQFCFRTEYVRIFICLLTLSIIHSSIDCCQLKCIVLFSLVFKTSSNNCYAIGVYQSFPSSFTRLPAISTGLPAVPTCFYSFNIRFYLFISHFYSFASRFYWCPISFNTFLLVYQSFQVLGITMKQTVFEFILKMYATSSNIIKCWIMLDENSNYFKLLSNTISIFFCNFSPHPIISSTWRKKYPTFSIQHAGFIFKGFQTIS